MNRVPDRVTRMGSQVCRDFGGKKILAKIRGKKKSCYRKNCSAVDSLFTSHITFRFEITIKRLYVRFLHKQKVTKLRSRKLHLSKSD